MHALSSNITEMHWGDAIQVLRNIAETVKDIHGMRANAIGREEDSNTITEQSKHAKKGKKQTGNKRTLQSKDAERSNTIGREQASNKPLVYCDLKPEIKICDFWALRVVGDSTEDAVTTEGFEGPEFKRTRNSSIQSKQTSSE